MLPTARLLQRPRAPHPSLLLSQAVKASLAKSRPVVALESTIISHGLPYPLNLQVARELEAVIHENGATPATIAIVDGVPKVGLEDSDLNRLAECALPEKSELAIKTSRRDISYIMAKGKGFIGGTTVSGTMVLAHMAGIDIFATGGIGGVHRGGETSMDVSADLSELSRTPVSVFCSGPKSILDIPRTLEVLESLGVGVLTFNDKTSEFPSFYTSKSGLKVPRVASFSDAAKVILSAKEIGLESGHVFGVPIPSSYEAEGEQIQQAVERAVRESFEQGIDKKGKEVTPWLLKRVGELAPQSKDSNRALVVNNAKFAAKTAVEYEKMREERRNAKNTHSLGGLDESAVSKRAFGDLLVFGSAAVDLTSTVSSSVPKISSAFHQATTFPGRVEVSLGGVGRNIAEAAHKILSPSSSSSSSMTLTPVVKLVAPYSRKDVFGKILIDGLRDLGMRTDGLFSIDEVRRSDTHQISKFDGTRTAVCSLVLDGEGDLVSGVADMDIPAIDSSSPLLDSEGQQSLWPELIAIDGNLSPESIAHIISSSTTEEGRRIPILFEPTSLAKSTRILEAFEILEKVGWKEDGRGRDAPFIHFSTPNYIELKQMHKAAREKGLILDTCNVEEIKGSLERILQESKLPDFIGLEMLVEVEEISRLIGTVFVKFGSRGVLGRERLIAFHQPACQLESAPSSSQTSTVSDPASTVVNTTGAGDSFAGGILAGQYLNSVGILNLGRRGVAAGPWSSSESRERTVLEKICRLGQLAAGKSLVSNKAVGDGLDMLVDKI
ncbi:hypothetical protein IE53DRAFT_374631 [Violaceomyces palustris]|uniref:Uncharacterized protein n=1 Tax=Violaceomyces palustris TaxID=1673888 RepID=A0ACD0NX60_9BASI|nr:hypothetical protein IE53DRAFT_374631 [Violaceomyces palustris]